MLDAVNPHLPNSMAAVLPNATITVRISHIVDGSPNGSEATLRLNGIYSSHQPLLGSLHQTHAGFVDVSNSNSPAIVTVHPIKETRNIEGDNVAILQGTRVRDPVTDYFVN